MNTPIGTPEAVPVGVTARYLCVEVGRRPQKGGIPCLSRSLFSVMAGFWRGKLLFCQSRGSGRPSLLPVSLPLFLCLFGCGLLPLKVRNTRFANIKSFCYGCTWGGGKRCGVGWDLLTLEDAVMFPGCTGDCERVIQRGMLGNWRGELSF